MLQRPSTTKNRPNRKKSVKPASRLKKRREKLRETIIRTSDLAARAAREVEGTKRRRQASSLEPSLPSLLLQSLRISIKNQAQLPKLQMSSLTGK